MDFWRNISESIYSNLLVEERWRIMAEGLAVTVQVSLWSILLATAMGGLLCAMRMNRRHWMQVTVRSYVELMRAVPILVLLLLLFYVILTDLPLSGMWVAIISFILYFSAYFCETFRTGIESVDRGQWEAGFALGLKKFQTFTKIIQPQALTRIIPVFKGEVITLIKTTSVVGYVAVIDLTKASDILRSTTLDALFPLLLVTVVYIVLSQLTGWGLDVLDRHFTPKNRES